MPPRFVLAGSLVVLVFAPCAQAQEVYRPALDDKLIEATFGTEWYGLYLKGTKVGYFHSSRARVGNHICDAAAMTMKLTASGKKTQIDFSQFQHFDSKAPYRLVSGGFEHKDNQTQQTIAFKTQGKGYQVTSTINGVARQRQVESLDYTYADVIAAEAWLRAGPKLGARILNKQLDPQEMVLDDQTLKVAAIKNSLVNGVEVRYYEVDSSSKLTGITGLTLCDTQGRLLSGAFAGLFELRRETPEQAKNIEYSQDLFILGVAKVDRALGAASQITSLVLEVDAKAGGGVEDGPHQTVASAADGKRLLKLGAKHGKPAKATPKEIEDNLRETSALPIHDPKIKELTAKAIGDAQTPEQKLKRIVDFVKDFVQPSLMATKPNIHDLLDKKKGDCKSYALLTTTLCRAAGIPAREVSGLVYMGDDQQAFGGHRWNEVVLNGVWVPIDASRRQIELDAGHISFGPDHRAANQMLTTLGKLSFRLVEVERK